jgi:flagellar L-ring protein precursor FlgH
VSRGSGRSHRQRARCGAAAAACALLALAGCRSVPDLEAADSSTAVDAGTAAAAPASRGAIYQRTYYAPLFENPTARRVGDLVTVRLEERTTAAKSATTSTSKSTSAQIPGPIIGGRPVTVNGVPILETDIGSEHEFDGQGDSQQSNRLDGSIAVTVVSRLPNGNLVVRGQKWLQLNQGKEFVRIEGVIRPIDLEPDNSLPSWKVADAKIAYGGKGVLNEANSMGWLARFFQSPVMPF